MTAAAATAAPQPVLVLTDLSEAADQAICEAETWCQRTGASLVVCHAMPNTVATIAPLLPHQRIVVPPHAELEAARAAVHRQVQACTGRSPHGYALVVERAKPAVLADEVAAKIDAQLLVVGCTRDGGTASGRAAAETLAQSSHVPVLVVRKANHDGIVVATSAARGAPPRASAWAAIIANASDEALAVVHDLDPASIARRRDASLIVIDGDSPHDDPLDIVRRATCSVLVIRGAATH